MDFRVHHSKARINLPSPGKPLDNIDGERFNEPRREKCLNKNWLETPDEAKYVLEAWRERYNKGRPDMALNDQSAGEFIGGLKSLDDLQRV